MKRTLQAALCCTLAGAAIGAAHADCKEDLDHSLEAARKLEESDDFRQTLRQLHKAALLLEANEQGGLCEDVADAMQSMVEKRKHALQKQARLRALQNAPPIVNFDRVLDMESLVDATVYDRKGEELGSLRAVTIDPQRGTVAYVVLSYGGFLGFGEKMIPIPFQRLHMTEQRGALVLDLDRDVLDQAAGLGDRPWPLRPPLAGQSGGAD